jgi:hypothetical protein
MLTDIASNNAFIRRAEYAAAHCAWAGLRALIEGSGILCAVDRLS